MSLVGSLLQVGLRLGLATRSSELVADVVSHQLRRVAERDEDGLRVGGHWQVGDRRGRIGGRSARWPVVARSRCWRR